jgi:FKBP-type peptidyl-prolyl cis-trans isomerase SlyD
MMSLLIGENMVVSMHYTLTNDQGTVIDKSEEAEPLTYLHGAGNIIPGLENALTGKVAEDELQVTVVPEEAYGEVIQELIQTVDRAAFGGVESLEAGMAFEAQGPDGQARRVVITHVEGDQVTVDGNHPLAGTTLNFDVKIVSVRAATEEEIAHGHVH